MKKILIVEDNEANMKLFADLLETQCYEIHKAYDGAEALKRLKGEKFDLLILDIQLPKLSGIELMKLMKEEKLEQPKTIIVSAFATQNEIRDAKMYGCDAYITKPINITEFLASVKTIVGDN